MSLGTEFTVNHPLVPKRWSLSLQRALVKDSWFMSSGFVGTDPLSNIIVEIEDLRKQAGYSIDYGLRSAMRGAAVAGDNILQGKEGSLDFMQDSLQINQIRNGLKSRGKFSEKLVPYNIRRELRDAQSQYWGIFLDELILAKLSGSLGVGVLECFDTTKPTSAARNVDGSIAFDGNDLRAPSSNRILYAGAAGTKVGLTAADKISLDLVDKALLQATRLDANTATKRKLNPLMIGGVKTFVLLMDTVNAFDLKANTTGRWYDIEKARLQGGIKDSKLVQQSMGVYESPAGRVILVSHEGMVKFSDYGAGANVKATRSLLLGAQAGTFAFGSDNGEQRFSWHEEMDDRGNQLVVDTGMIVGAQKCAYETAPGSGAREDFGVIALDSAAAW